MDSLDGFRSTSDAEITFAPFLRDNSFIRETKNKVQVEIQSVLLTHYFSSGVCFGFQMTFRGEVLS